jgi:predicted glutamine amidotransferase
VRSASRDSEYARVARKIAGASAAVAPGKACVVLGHIRRASPGMPVGRGFSHPFVEIRDGHAWAFAHNGGLEGYAFTEEEGLIDSQVVLRRLLSNLDGPSGEEVADATRRTEAQLRVEFPGYTALNFLLTDGTRLHAFRQCLRDESYYTLYYGRVGRSVLVCSQPISGTVATAMENGTLATVGANLAVHVTRVR